MNDIHGLTYRDVNIKIAASVGGEAFCTYIMPVHDKVDLDVISKVHKIGNSGAVRRVADAVWSEVFGEVYNGNLTHGFSQ